ncbi:MAG: LysM peptidoglycan-binding domain-containing protein [Chloroflexi bacterium]|nr:LysM peptidoglycan-binding domain-containing protein [Chloroflexota bacterium]
MPIRRVSASGRFERYRRSATIRVNVASVRQCLSHPSRAVLHGAVIVVAAGALFVGSIVQRPVATEPDRAVQSSGPTIVQVELSQPVVLQAGDIEPAAQALDTPKLQKHIVSVGETLSAIADRYGVSLGTIVAANQLSNPDLVLAGQELVILPTTGVLARPKEGETLRELASRYGVAPDSVASANGVAAVDAPVVANQVIVPGVDPPLPKQTASRAPAPRQSSGEQAVASASTPSDASGPRQMSSLIMGSDDAATPAAETQSADSAPAKPRGPVVYQVQDGDSIRSLAVQFGVSIKTILLANDIQDPDLIKVGTKLKVLPVTGVEHEVGKGETLADIARAYEVDMGPIIDFNGLSNPDLVRDGDKILIPGATARVVVNPPAPVVAAVAPKPATQAAAAGSASSARPASAAPAAAAAPARPAPSLVTGGGGAGVVKNAMAYLGYRYVFGGTSPAGFDCSGFVYYIHQVSGYGVSRGLWGQLNGGPRVTQANLQPGDTVFFANTYMPGLSHDGIYVGGGRFIHASDESTGVTISSLGDGYWGPRYIGAARLWN